MCRNTLELLYCGARTSPQNLDRDQGTMATLPRRRKRERLARIPQRERRARVDVRPPEPLLEELGHHVHVLLLHSEIHQPKIDLLHARLRVFGNGSALAAGEYLELQNKWPFFNRISSFFRGNSPSSLHFQSKIPTRVGICIAQYDAEEAEHRRVMQQRTRASHPSHREQKLVQHKRKQRRECHQPREIEVTVGPEELFHYKKSTFFNRKSGFLIANQDHLTGNSEFGIKF